MRSFDLGIRMKHIALAFAAIAALYASNVKEAVAQSSPQIANFFRSDVWYIRLDSSFTEGFEQGDVIEFLGPHASYEGWYWARKSRVISGKGVMGQSWFLYYPTVSALFTYDGTQLETLPYLEWDAEYQVLRFNIPAGPVLAVPRNIMMTLQSPLMTNATASLLFGG